MSRLGASLPAGLKADMTLSADSSDDCAAAAKSAAPWCPVCSALSISSLPSWHSISDLTSARPSPVPSALRAKGRGDLAERLQRQRESVPAPCRCRCRDTDSTKLPLVAVLRADAHRAAGRGEFDGVGAED